MRHQSPRSSLKDKQSFKSWSRTFQVKDISSFLQNSMCRKKILTQPSILEPEETYLNLSGLRDETIQNNMDFIYRKINSINADNFSHLGKLYRNKSKMNSQQKIQNKNKKVLNLSLKTQQTQSERPQLYTSLNKKYKHYFEPIKQDSARYTQNKSKNYKKNQIFIYTPNKMNRLSYQHQSVQSSEQKVNRFLAAQEKNTNQRILRLLLKQQQNQERYSVMKNNILRKMQDKNQKRLSKRYSYCMSNGLRKCIQLRNENKNKSKQ